ncbi:MAG: hypothetical protein KIT87_14515 [Anaerolineae bacterium]|nr:hypothetical protein [Anaerolineae bacterium]
MKFVGLVLSLIGLTLAACGAPQPAAPAAPTGIPQQADTVLVPLSYSRETTQVTLSTLGGDLRLRGGAAELMQGVITRTVTVAQPSLTAQPGQVGLTQMNPSGGQSASLGQAVNQWDLRLNNSTPMQLTIQGGDQTADLDFGGLYLRGLSLSQGASTAKLNFSQPNPDDMRRVTINTGASKMELLNLLNARFSSLLFEGGTGNYTFDFGGKAQRPAQAQIRVASGMVTIRVPSDVGTRFTATGVKPSLAGDWITEGASYLTPNWRKSEALDLTVILTQGDLRLETRAP